MGQEKGKAKSWRRGLELINVIRELAKMVIAKSVRGIFLSVFSNHVKPILCWEDLSNARERDVQGEG
jgi:hypothetical protein